MISHKVEQSNILSVPRSHQILLLQWGGILLLFCPFYIFGVSIISGRSITIVLSNIGSVIILFCVVFWLPAFLLIYFPQKYVQHIIIAKDNNILRIEKKGIIKKEFLVNHIIRFVSQDVLYPASSFKKFILIIETTDNKSITLFEDDEVMFLRGWHHFADRLSAITGKPLKKEVWTEKQTGI